MGLTRPPVRRPESAFAGEYRGGIFRGVSGVVEDESFRWGYTGEFKPPTCWFTLIGKYYQGADLRAYFDGQLFSTFTDMTCLTGIQTATSIDGSSTFAFGFLSGQPVIADQNAIPGYGGFINLGIPLTRIFGTEPKDRMAGWSTYLHYGVDAAVSSDVRRLLGYILNKKILRRKY